MKVSRTSWHYNLIDVLSSHRDIKDGCGYMREVIKLVVVCIFMVLVALCVIILPGMLLTPNIKDLSLWEQISTVAGISAAVWGLVAVIGYVYYKLKPKDKIKTPSFVKQYVQAKKDKYCPRLEYVD